MKKYALVLSLLSASLASNCMEKEHIIAITSPDKLSSVIINTNGKTMIQHANAPIFCTKPSPSTQLTTKAQEKISLVPKVIFSLNDEEIQKLRIILTQKDQIQSSKTELFNILRNKGVTLGTQSIIENLIDLEHQDINIDKQLNIHLTSEDQQLSDNLEQQIKQMTNQISNVNINKLITEATSVIDQLIPLYLKTEAIQKFIDELMKKESNKLFIPIKENCQNQINYLTKTINNLTQTLDNFTESLPQEQTSSNK